MKRCTGRNCIMQYDKVDPATCQAVDYCPQATPPKTIADKLRAMTDEEMATIATLERDNRLVKGQVFLWPGANDWHDLWDEGGFIVDCPDAV